MSNILRVKFGTSRTVNAEALWQYDYGQILVMEGIDLPVIYEVHFAKYGDATSYTVLGDADGVPIPDILLQTPGEIRAWLYLHTGENDGETEYQINIQVQLRAEPSNGTPTPVQQDIITEAVAIMQSVFPAGEIGLMDFHFDNDGWLVYERTSNINIDFEIEEGVLYAVWLTA